MRRRLSLRVTFFISDAHGRRHVAPGSLIVGKDKEILANAEGMGRAMRGEEGMAEGEKKKKKDRQTDKEI